MTARRVTTYLHSRGWSHLMLVVSLTAAVVAWLGGDTFAIEGDFGFGIPSPNQWLAGSPLLSLAAGVATAGAIYVLIISVNKIFNVMRSTSALPSALFMAAMMSTPTLESQFNGGLLMCLIMWVITAVMFSTFGVSDGMQRRVFLMFFGLSAASLCQYAFLFYMPVLLVGTVQMRTFGARTLLAAVIGVVTPVWLLLGFDVLSPSDFRLPEFVNVFRALQSDRTVLTLASIGLTALIGLTFMTLNIFKVIAYNARVRAFYGFLSSMTIWTIVLICADFTHLVTYMPLLATLSAFQAGHYFSTINNTKAYIPIISIFTLYFALYICNLVL